MRRLRRWSVALATVRHARLSIAIGTVLVVLTCLLGAARPGLLGWVLHGFDLTSFRSPAYGRRLLAFLTHNAVADYACIWLGRARGVFPAIWLLLNGTALGIAFADAADRAPLGTLLAAIVPHGIFELPANLVSGGLGLWIGAAVWLHLGPTAQRKRRRRSNLVFLCLVLPLWVVAAAMEAR